MLLPGWSGGSPRVGTATDRPSMDFLGSGDESQQDCVDEATNTTSYLLLLQRHDLIHHHHVERPFAKDSATRWTHWAALIRDKRSGNRFAIDSSSSPNGVNPTVQAAASFYVPDGPNDNMPPETSGPSTANAGETTMTPSLGYAEKHSVNRPRRVGQGAIALQWSCRRRTLARFGSSGALGRWDASVLEKKGGPLVRTPSTVDKSIGAPGHQEKP